MEIDLEKWGDKLCWLVGVPLAVVVAYLVWSAVLKPRHIEVVLPTPTAVEAVQGGGEGETPAPVAAPIVEATETPTFTATPAIATPQPTPTSISASDVAVGNVSFEDHSARWQWHAVANADCRETVRSWMSKYDWASKVKSLKVILVDDEAGENLRPGPKGEERRLVIGVGWPDSKNYTALADGGCVVKEGKATCYVAPRQGDGKGVSAAVSIAWAYALEDYFRPKTMQAWEEMSKNWSWRNYRPLVKQEGEQWVSNCMEIEPGE